MRPRAMNFNPPPHRVSNGDRDKLNDKDSVCRVFIFCLYIYYTLMYKGYNHKMSFKINAVSTNHQDFRIYNV